MRRSLSAGCTVALVLAARAAGAVGPPQDDDRAVPCRPTIACTAEFANPGALELEAGGIYRHSSVDTTNRQTPFLFKLTLAPWLQLQAGSNGYTVTQAPSPARYFDNVAVGLKFHFLDQKGYVPALAVSGAVSFPTPSGQEGYTSAYDANFIGYITKDMGPIHADLNVGTNVFRLNSGPSVQGWGALALSVALPAPADPFGLMAETYVFSDATPYSTKDSGLLLAVSHSPRKWLVFDVGADIGFFPSTRAYSVFVGMTIVPVVFFR
jgi:hypothetical protein